ncbi:MAG: aminotransferase class I/II-fold pyridoxal phosphate-dependent enzyme [Dehalococcoidia bacterium]
MINWHGGTPLQMQREGIIETSDDVLDFSSNTNASAVDLSKLTLRNLEVDNSSYPDDESSLLRDAIAQHEGVLPANVMVGNGSAEMIYLTLLAMRPKHVTIVSPIFSEYVAACQAYEIPYQLHSPNADTFILSDEDIQTITDTQSDMLILCTPNNPTGVTYSNVNEILSNTKAKWIVIDNCYKEFLYGSVEYTKNCYVAYQNLAPESVITINSFTKFFCCPGIRLGYLIASESCLKQLKTARAPWMVSSYAEVAGLEFLRNIEKFRDTIHEIGELKELEIDQLRRMDIFDSVYESSTNFIIAKTRHSSEARELYEFLLKKGIIVRLCDNIPGMPQGFIRLQTKPLGDFSRLVESTKGWMKSVSHQKNANKVR